MTALLVWRHLVAHKIRSALTLGTIAIAVFLLCFLGSVIVALTAGVEQADARRAVVQSAVSLFVDLPLSYQGKIESVPGVESTCKLQYFGGIYKEPSNYFGQFGVDPDRLFDMYPEIELDPAACASFQAGRMRCIVGAALAARFGWTVGMVVPLQGTIFPRLDGAAWPFEIAGIYTAKGTSGVDQNTMYFHFAALQEAIESGSVRGEVVVGVYAVKLKPGASMTGVCGAIDAMFANGPQRVQATTEAEFNRQFVSMLGNVPMLLNAIGGGVLFAIALAALNTMLMAGREHTRSVGIMKALGFTDRSVALLLLGESLALCGGGGLVGVAVVKGLESVVVGAMSSIAPTYAISPLTMAVGVGAAVAIGLVAGLVPAWNAARLRPVAALRMEA